MLITITAKPTSLLSLHTAADRFKSRALLLLSLGMENSGIYTNDIDFDNKEQAINFDGQHQESIRKWIRCSCIRPLVIYLSYTYHNVTA